MAQKEEEAVEEVGGGRGKEERGRAGSLGELRPPA